MPTPADIDQVRAATTCLVNLQRRHDGLAPLVDDGQLQGVAQAHSDDMVARDYFDHTSPSGATATDRILHSGYVSDAVSWAIGENIAYGTMNLATPSEVVTAWMNSPGHRANILDPGYRQTGMGVTPAVASSLSEGQAGAMYTQDFGAHGRSVGRALGPMRDPRPAARTHRPHVVRRRSATTAMSSRG